MDHRRGDASGNESAAMTARAPRCKGCEQGLPILLLDKDGCMTHVSKRPPGSISHAVGDAWWPCKLYKLVAAPAPSPEEA